MNLVLNGRNRRRIVLKHLRWKDTATRKRSPRDAGKGSTRDARKGSPRDARKRNAGDAGHRATAGEDRKLWLLVLLRCSSHKAVHSLAYKAWCWITEITIRAHSHNI